MAGSSWRVYPRINGCYWSLKKRERGSLQVKCSPPRIVNGAGHFGQKTYHMNLDQTTRDDIQRDGYNQAKPLASARTGAEQRAKEYNEHCKRMEADPEYRMKWEQRERELQEAKQRNYYY